MSELNLVVLGGRLVCAPELRLLPPHGRSVCFLRVACPAAERALCGPGAPREEFDVLVLGPEALRVARHLHPERGVVVRGSLQMESWEAGEGPQHEAACVLADDVCRGTTARPLTNSSTSLASLTG